MVSVVATTLFLATEVGSPLVSWGSTLCPYFAHDTSLLALYAVLRPHNSLQPSA